MHHTMLHGAASAPRRTGAAAPGRTARLGAASMMAACVFLATLPPARAADGIVPARATSHLEGRREGVRGEREYIIRDTRRSKRGELDCSVRGSQCVVVDPGSFRRDPMKRKDREYLWKRKR
ncbi:hypothetical protein [Azospirillum sp.]|uniref:hypothetical protein n=1 Tax=Azospirillum sp. TaxID=34012 RepID=UPI003D739B76